MKQYQITGMSCAACSARVEKAVTKVEGVTSCTVSLLTNSMSVGGTVSEEAVVRAVEQAGYGVKRDSSEPEADKDSMALRNRLIASVCFLICLMYVSMGHMMWGWPLPTWFDGNHVAMGLVQLLLAGVIMVINQRFFISGFKSLWHKAPNMDTLVALGSSASFVWSVYVLFEMTRAQTDGNIDSVMSYMMEFYFESAAMILTLITVGKMLESRAKGKTTDALKGLMKLAPKTAVIVENGEEITVSVEQVKKGDVFVVKPGEAVPVDGIIIKGVSAVNESALTGESIPVDKGCGDEVSAATLNESGYLQCEATRVGEDTTLSRIIQMVSDAAATKAPIAKIADRVSGVFVPAVITIAIVTTIVWLFITGGQFGYALSRGIAVLVISCPCALGLATPVAIMVGNGVGAKNGILFKTAVSLEQTGKVKVVALDKTGTITKGEPEVTDIITGENVEEKELLYAAVSLEQKSEHPLARAVIRYADGYVGAEVSDFEVLPGKGLKGRIGTDTLFGGNLSYITGQATVHRNMIEQAETLASQGKTPLLFAVNDRFLGVIAVADTIREDSPQAVRELQEMGISVVMLTGDNKRTAEAVGRDAGVNEVIAGVLPDGKERVIQDLQKKGMVAMVGDGINDAPALTRADVGIAIGAGTDIAMDAADVVLMKSSLTDAVTAIRLSRATLTNIHQNLFWAFFYNVIGIPLAAGVFIPLFGWTLNPTFAAAAMSLSSFCVVSNALRLNLFRVKQGEKDSGNGIVRTMHIEGMMCEHCENRVKKALESIPEVTNAEVSYKDGTAVINMQTVVSAEVLKQYVEEQDYTVSSVE